MTKQEIYIHYWTHSSVECYNRGCNCMNCPIKNIMTSQQCRMKKMVMELVTHLGRPELTYKENPQ